MTLAHWGSRVIPIPGALAQFCLQIPFWDQDVDTFCGEGAYLLTTLIEQMTFSRSHFPGEGTRAQVSGGPEASLLGTGVEGMVLKEESCPPSHCELS